MTVNGQVIGRLEAAYVFTPHIATWNCGAVLQRALGKVRLYAGGLLEFTSRPLRRGSAEWTGTISLVISVRGSRP